MSELRAEHLTIRYRSVTAVWDVSLSVGSGEILTIVGRNGAGKTTTLSAIAGILRVTDGRIFLDGADITASGTHERVRKGISLVQEGKRIFRRLSVQDNLVLGAYAQRGSHRATLHTLGEVYERFPMLAERRRFVAGSLSGGQQQMLAVAQALVAKPRFLLLDEPSAGLSPLVAHQVFEIVQQLAQEGLGIILVEQLVDEALELAHQILVLDVGRILASGAPTGIDVWATLRGEGTLQGVLDRRGKQGE